MAQNWADWISAITEAVGFVDSASAHGAQQELDEDMFEQLRRQNFQGMATLEGLKDQIGGQYDLALENNQVALDPRRNTAQRTATLQQLQRGRTKGRDKLLQSQAARGVTNSGAAQRAEATLETGFQDSIAKFDATEQQAALDRQMRILQSKFGSLAPIVAQIAQMQARAPQQRERAGGFITQGLSDLFG